MLTDGPRLGAHMSVAGGLPRAVERAVLHGCQSLQIFSKNASQWRGRPLGEDEVREFRDRVRASGIRPVVSHASYLINLGTDDAAVRGRSLEAMADEISRAEALGLDGVVLHPGCYTSGSVDRGVALVAEGLSEILSNRPAGSTQVLLEHTAGQGTALGANFQEIAAIIAATSASERIGVCLDTCHLLASGYDIATAEGYEATFEAFGTIVGLDRLKVFHLNDSKKPLGSRIDRHTHIGEGCVGLEAFRRLVNDPRFTYLPMLLETPKEDAPARNAIVVDKYDQRNLDLLRSLIAQRPR